MIECFISNLWKYDHLSYEAVRRNKRKSMVGCIYNEDFT